MFALSRSASLFLVSCCLGLFLIAGLIQPRVAYSAPINTEKKVEKVHKKVQHAKAKKPHKGKVYRKKSAQAATKRPARAQGVAASLLVDATNGKVLHQHNASKQLYPASLTKMMTLYLAFEALAHGKLQLGQHLQASHRATSMKPARLGLRPGDSISVQDALLALIIKSANDVAVTVAENLAGSEEEFAREMTKRARMLGMNNTTFRNASGWSHPEQVTTAYDMAKLAIALKRDFPQYYKYFSKTSFNFRGRHIEGHNRITKHYHGADGLKTGYFAAAGFNIVSTAKRGEHSGIAVVLGGKSSAERDHHVRHLLDQFFKYKHEETQVATIAGTN